MIYLRFKGAKPFERINHKSFSEKCLSGKNAQNSAKCAKFRIRSAKQRKIGRIWTRKNSAKTERKNAQCISLPPMVKNNVPKLSKIDSVSTETLVI
jgi:hypothetical protein